MAGETSSATAAQNTFFWQSKETISLNEFFKLIYQADTSLKNPHLLKCSVFKCQISEFYQKWNCFDEIVSYEASLPFLLNKFKVNKNNDIFNLERSTTKQSIKEVISSTKYLTNNVHVQKMITSSSNEEIFDMLPQLSRRLPGYWFNLTFPDDVSILQNFVKKQSLIDKENNAEVNEMPGINTSMYYIGLPGSFSEMHIEDSDLASINVIREALQEADHNTPANIAPIAKLWLIVPNKQALIEALAGETSKNQNQCLLKIYHKDLYVTVKFLNSHNIQYGILEQRVGEAVYIKPSIFHQVINVLPNIAEAINYGSLLWNDITKSLVNCTCESCRYTKITDNKEVMVVRRMSKRQIHLCDQPKCEATFFNQKLLQKHRREDHQIAKPFTCELCQKSWASYFGQYNHFCTASAGVSESIGQSSSVATREVENTTRDDIINAEALKNIQKSYCAVCQIYVTQIKRHQNSKRHVQNGTSEALGKQLKSSTMITTPNDQMITLSFKSYRQCEKCKKKFLSEKTLNNHKCIKDRPYQCCGKYYSKRSYNVHKSSKLHKNKFG